MPHFIVHNAEGKILKSGHCQDQDVALQAQNDGEIAIVGEGTQSKHYVKNGNIIEMPPKPSEWHEFDYSLESWVDSKSVSDKNAEIMQEVRIERAGLFSSTDWTQMPDSPLTEAQRAEWAAYRQALRDVPQNNANATSLDEVQWPLKPEA